MNYYKINGGIIKMPQKLNDAEAITKEEYNKLYSLLNIESKEDVEYIAPPTAEERIEALEAALIELVEVVCNG